MIVGLPGAGISTAFYLIAVALMPFHTLFLIVAGRQLRRGHVLLLIRQTAISAGIILALLATALVLSVLITATGADAIPAGAEADQVGQLWRTISRLGTVFAVATLVVVVTVIKVLSIWVSRPRDERHPGDA